jgi:hypothetical protein
MMYPIIVREKTGSTKWVVITTDGSDCLIAEIITGHMKVISFSQLEESFKFVKLVRGEISVGE